ncbi:MAG: hypothetical protein PF482_14475 [Desulfobacteraceae bacterium]|jgi:hypothetical protein|nr:hypothetical protein [Desulfobacteraceae bacterium]
MGWRENMGVVENQFLNLNDNIDNIDNIPMETRPENNSVNLSILSMGNEIQKNDTSGDCESCPACGTWDYAGYTGKQLCFHRAYFIGKSGKPVLCDIAKLDCPKNVSKE